MRKTICKYVVDDSVSRKQQTFKTKRKAVLAAKRVANKYAALNFHAGKAVVQVYRQCPKAGYGYRRKAVYRCQTNAKRKLVCSVSRTRTEKLVRF